MSCCLNLKNFLFLALILIANVTSLGNNLNKRSIKETSFGLATSNTFAGLSNIDEKVESIIVTSNFNINMIGEPDFETFIIHG